jgi:hypothetical protein
MWTIKGKMIRTVPVAFVIVMVRQEMVAVYGFALQSVLTAWSRCLRVLYPLKKEQEILKGLFRTTNVPHGLAIQYFVFKTYPNGALCIKAAIEEGILLPIHGNAEICTVGTGLPDKDVSVSEDYTVDDKAMDNEADTNLDDCYICDDGGSLVCCDGCEKAYHAGCLNVDENALPDIWYGPCCESIESNTRPKRGASSSHDSSSTSNTRPKRGCRRGESTQDVMDNMGRKLSVGMK